MPLANGIDVTEARADHRVNLFVLAKLSSGAASIAVRVRNLSTSGALVEGDALPPAGTSIILDRGENAVRGFVVWNANNRAGLRFDGCVTVDCWTPGGHARQREVDRTFQQIKAGILPTSMPTDCDGTSPSELNVLAEALDDLANALADEAELVGRLGCKVQTLDIVAQALRKIARR